MSTQQLADDIEIVVLAHSAKLAITAETLGELEIPYRIFENIDYDFPHDHPEKKTSRASRPGVRGYALRQYRAFMGHQQLLASATKPYTMVFEDDMSLARGISTVDVLRHINGARRFITAGYDAVSFHGRKQSTPELSVAMFDREYVELSPEIQESPAQLYFLSPVLASFDGKYADGCFRWHEGCLAYLAGPVAKEKWLAAGHGSGMPCDLFLVNELRTLVMRHTIFHHDHRHGSLIANEGRAKQLVNADGTPIQKK